MLLLDVAPDRVVDEGGTLAPADGWRSDGDDEEAGGGDRPESPSFEGVVLPFEVDAPISDSDVRSG